MLLLLLPCVFCICFALERPFYRPLKIFHYTTFLHKIPVPLLRTTLELRKLNVQITSPEMIRWLQEASLKEISSNIRCYDPSNGYKILVSENCFIRLILQTKEARHHWMLELPGKHLPLRDEVIRCPWLWLSNIFYYWYWPISIVQNVPESSGLNLGLEFSAAKDFIDWFHFSLLPVAIPLLSRCMT